MVSLQSGLSVVLCGVEVVRKDRSLFFRGEAHKAFAAADERAGLLTVFDRPDSPHLGVLQVEGEKSSSDS